MRGAFESAQGLCPTRRVRQSDPKDGYNYGYNFIVCQCCLLSFTTTTPRGPAADPQNISKTYGKINIFAKIDHFTSARCTVTFQPNSAGPPPQFSIPKPKITTSICDSLAHFLNIKSRDHDYYLRFWGVNFRYQNQISPLVSAIIWLIF